MEEVPLREAIGERGRELPEERSTEYASSAICCNSNAATKATKQLHDRQKMPIFHEDETLLAAARLHRFNSSKYVVKNSGSSSASSGSTELMSGTQRKWATLNRKVAHLNVVLPSTSQHR